MSNVPPPPSDVPPPSGSVPPPAASSVPPAASVPPASPYAPVPGQARKQTLSLISFIVGLASLVIFSLWGGALLPGIAAIVLGVLGRSREPQAPRWMWIIGIIAGALSIVVTVIVLALFIIGAVAASNSASYYNN